MTGKPEASLHTVRSLLDAGLASPDEASALEAVAKRYAVALTPTVVRLIDPHDSEDPIARQFVPDASELLTLPDEADDPIGDEAFSPVTGLVHRHADRVLFKLVHVCPVYCRFCFRRAMVGPGKRPALNVREIDAALAYIAQHTEIWEVIFTGGDPFLLSPRRTAALVERLAAIGHVRVLRWHTRVPVVEPARVTAHLARALKHPRLASYVAVHVNHPRELTPDARRALARLADHGIALLSQSVLLRGVNNDPETLEALMRALVEARVKPYYLHHLDPAPGTSHWRTEIGEGQGLMATLRTRASGLCQPLYVIDMPKGRGKVPLYPSWSEPAAPCDCKSSLPK